MKVEDQVTESCNSGDMRRGGESKERMRGEGRGGKEATIGTRGVTGIWSKGVS